LVTSTIVVLACSVDRLYSSLFVFFFFFQAEDGIRDFHVTGVQTCALPISLTALRDGSSRMAFFTPDGTILSATDTPSASIRLHRSEERRVGKECRSRWSPYQ